MKYKSLQQAYRERFGKEPPTKVSKKDYWKVFNLTYSEINTPQLLVLLTSMINISENDFTIKDHEMFYNCRNALKEELKTREHIPTKSERKILRQQKNKHK